MITIRGIITEISQGVETNSITIAKDKAKSKLRFSPMDIDLDEFNIGDQMTIVIERDKTLFDKE